MQLNSFLHWTTIIGLPVCTTHWIANFLSFCFIFVSLWPDTGPDVPKGLLKQLSGRIRYKSLFCFNLFGNYFPMTIWTSLLLFFFSFFLFSSTFQKISGIYYQLMYILDNWHMYGINLILVRISNTFSSLTWQSENPILSVRS